jgi:hypothetical protein
MSVAKLKKELDKEFSIFIRTRDLDESGRATCFTCGVKKPWKQMHAGHFQSRSKLKTRFNPVNVQVQCPKCNLWSQGEQYQFGINLDKRYGEGTADNLRVESEKRGSISQAEYKELIAHYKEAAKNNLEEGGRSW